MKAIAFTLLAFGLAHAEDCRTFNFKYKACFEDWVSEDVKVGISQGMENNGLRHNFNFKKQTKGDTVVFIVSTRSNETIEFLSRLPYDMREEMPKSFAQTYGNFLSALGADHIRTKWKDFENPVDTAKTVAEAKAFMKRFTPICRFDLLDNAGKLAKSYDLTEFVTLTQMVAGWREQAGLNE